MLLFGHIGITLASAVLGFGLTDKLRHGIAEDRLEEISTNRDDYSSNKHQDRKASFFRSLTDRLDIRFLLAGSILPDIIDKPIGIYFLGETLSSGRIFSHTLLFLTLVTVVGLMLKRYSGKSWVLALSLGTLFHLILDQMWQMPKTLFWPLLGLAFERMDTSNWLGNIIVTLLTKPEVYVPEIIGMIILISFIWDLLHSRELETLIKSGKPYSR